MMNYVGTIAADVGCRKIAAQAPKIDGHAPEVKGKALNAYVAAGASDMSVLLLVRL